MCLEYLSALKKPDYRLYYYKKLHTFAHVILDVSRIDTPMGAIASADEVVDPNQLIHSSICFVTPCSQVTHLLTWVLARVTSI